MQRNKKSEQLDLLKLIERKKQEEDVYVSGAGEPLPWETEEYLKHEKEKNYE